MTKQVLYGHFYLYEMFHSDISDRNGIDNTTIDPVIIQRGVNIAKNILTPIRDHYNIPYSPTSWFRCEELEQLLCNHDFHEWCSRHGHEADAGSWITYFQRKQHPKGCAVDLKIPGISTLELFTWIRDNLEFDQLLKEYYRENYPFSGWVHCSFVEHANRMQVLTIS